MLSPEQIQKFRQTLKTELVKGADLNILKNFFLQKGNSEEDWRVVCEDLKQKKKSKLKLIILVILILSIIGGGMWWWFFGKNEENKRGKNLGYYWYANNQYIYKLIAIGGPENTEIGKDFFNIDIKSSQAINRNYIKDKKYVYYLNYYKKDGYILNKIENADPETFEVLDYSYVKDKNYVFLKNRIIKDADSQTFEVINYQYAKDKNHVYKNTKILKDVNPETFDPENI